MATGVPAHDRTDFDDYVVRLQRPDAAVDLKAGKPEPTAVRTRRRRLRRRIMLLAALVAVLAFRPAIHDFVERIAGEVVDDLTTVDEGLPGAVHALNTLYAEQGTYEVRTSDLQTLAPNVEWDAEMTRDVCFGGHGVIVTDHSGIRIFSRLLVQGEQWGHLPGERDCPRSMDQTSPWPGPADF